MARGDDISDQTGQITGNTYIYLTPSSGDEWMITGMGSDNYNFEIRSFPKDTGDNYYRSMGFPNVYGAAGSTNKTPKFQESYTSHQPLKWFLSNAKPLRLQDSAGWHTIWWMGIKTKE